MNAKANFTFALKKSLLMSGTKMMSQRGVYDEMNE